MIFWVFQVRNLVFREDCDIVFEFVHLPDFLFNENRHVTFDTGESRF